MSAFFYILSCVSKDLTIGRSSVQEVQPKCLNSFTVSEVNFGPEEATGPIPRKVQQS